VHLSDGSIADGRIRDVDDDGVVLVTDAKGKPESVERRVPWVDVARGEVQVEFRRPEADPVPADDEEA
jgi:hypothetical protein